MATVTWQGDDGTNPTHSTVDANWDTGSAPSAGDHVVIANVTNNCVLQGATAWGSVVIQSGGDLNGNGQTLTLNDGGDAEIFKNYGVIIGNLDVTITGTTSRNIRDDSTGNIRNLTIAASSGTPTFTTTNTGLTLTGNLTITRGELDTGSDLALTVAGATSIGDGSASADTATLTCNASTVSLGSGYSTTWGLQIERGGTFVGGSGAHTFGSFKLGAAHADVKCTLTSGVTTIDDEKTGDNYTIYLQDSTFDDANGTVTITHNGDARFQLGGEPLHNVIINHADCSMQISSDAVINGDLTITAGEFKGSYGGTHYDLTVGSLTIASGATYNATSGTTTIKNETSDYAFKNDGTFTHNKGEVFIDGNTDDVANTEIQSDDFYDLRMDAQTTNHEVKWSDKSGNALTIYNNLTITQGSFEGKDAGDTLTIHGLTNIGATGKFGADANQTGQITHHGLVTNLGTYFINDTTTVKMNGGFRQLNALTIS